MNLPVTIQIGNIRILFQCPSAMWLKLIKKNYGPFLAKKSGAAELTVELGPAIKHQPEKGDLEVKKENGFWQINRYDFHSISSTDLKRTFLLVENNKYALDSWLRVFFTLCGIERGSLLFHGAGFQSKHCTYVFPGRSGRGKSTLIRILGRSGALTDELVCVFSSGGGFRAASTPFWGELKKGTGKLHVGNLKALLFLRHGRNISLRALSRRAAAERILKSVLFFSRSTEHMSELLRLADDITNKTPAFELSFRKDSKKKDILKPLEKIRSFEEGIK